MDISSESIELYIIILVSLLLIYLLLNKFGGKTESKEKFLYMGVHNYHKDSYKHGQHGLGSKRNPWNFSNLRFSDFIPFLSHIIL